MYKHLKRFKVVEGSGLDSGRIGFLQDTHNRSARFFEKIEPGRYKPFNPVRESLLYDTTREAFFTMFKSRLVPFPARSLTCATKILPVPGTQDKRVVVHLWDNANPTQAILVEAYNIVLPYDPEDRHQWDYEGVIERADLECWRLAGQYIKGGDDVCVEPWF